MCAEESSGELAVLDSNGHLVRYLHAERLDVKLNDSVVLWVNNWESKAREDSRRGFMSMWRFGTLHYQLATTIALIRKELVKSIA